MKISFYSTLLISLFFFGCTSNQPAPKEPWTELPMDEWPSFALTNNITFTDTTFTSLANSFIIDTGLDTIGISCKHLFMVFEWHTGVENISLGDNFKSWDIYSKNSPSETISVSGIINEDKNEPIGQFNTLKSRDWLLLNIENNPTDIFPLKIRHTPIEPNEVVYQIGWSMDQETAIPSLIKLHYFKDFGPYYFMEPLNKMEQNAGRSGSPVIDKNGYLVGITSGQEGNMAVIGGVTYLREMLDKYSIEYKQQPAAK